jgi:hypothetical protein
MFLQLDTVDFRPTLAVSRLLDPPWDDSDPLNQMHNELYLDGRLIAGLQGMGLLFTASCCRPMDAGCVRH